MGAPPTAIAVSFHSNIKATFTIHVQLLALPNTGARLLAIMTRTRNGDFVSQALLFCIILYLPLESRCYEMLFSPSLYPLCFDISPPSLFCCRYRR